jgi:site-specific DNA-methyltransferase (adenine-specific)
MLIEEEPVPVGISPYYRDEHATLYLADCRDVLGGLRDLKLLIADPPYGEGWKSNFGQNHAVMAGDRVGGKSETVEILDLACQSIQNDRHAYIFGDFDLAPTRNLTAKADLVWNKMGSAVGDLSIPWIATWEPITFAVKTRPGRKQKGTVGGLTARQRQGAVLSVPKRNSVETRRHPSEKPVDLLRLLIESSSIIGETVLDPFAGVGSTGVAATLEGRKSVLIEIEESYCEVAAERLARASAAMDVLRRSVI